MLDRVWAAEPDISAFKLAKAGLLVRVIDPGSLSYVNGDLETALAMAGLNAVHGWPGAARGQTYAVRTGFDRMLLVGHALPPGWQGRFGVTDASDALLTFEIEGQHQLPLLRRLGEIDPSRKSASVSFLFAGFRCILYRHATSLRVHVTRHLASAFASHLTAVVSDLAP